MFLGVKGISKRYNPFMVGKMAINMDSEIEVIENMLKEIESEDAEKAATEVETKGFEK